MTNVDWANLGGLPLSLVLEKLEVQTDYVRFGVVCKNWLSIAKLNHKNHQFRINVLPMLMILSKGMKISLCNIPSFHQFSIFGQKEYPIPLSHPSIIKSKTCLGCSHGWLALVDNNNAITLVNPFKSSIAPISLPPLESRSLEKVTLSDDPITSPSDYVVAVIYNFSSLAFKRPSQSFWIRVNTNEFSFTGVVFYKGLIFADNTDTIVSFKLNNPSSDDSFDPNFAYYEKMASTPIWFPEQYYYGRAYFVKSLTGDIWMMRRFLTGKNLIRPYVFKLELDAQSGKLEQMNKLESLEDNILFVGSVGDSISVPASAFSKLEKDSIYVVNGGLEIDIYIYNMKDGSVQRPPSVLSNNWMQHFWVLPQLQWD
ncbi:hypothetical protein MtrunA17_Chr7g0247731 [Medicago truncatula]|nr:DUF295 family protein [Medicago truncatula]RHN46954.1 hypothetical protein MtrunA17_Chr7g0247731 [Medicago truncatula]